MILVTGATGFTGSNILSFLAEKYGKDQVVGCGRNLERIHELSAQGFSLFELDLENVEEVNLKCSKYTRIVHCAALSSPWGSYKEFYKANVLATQNLLQLNQVIQFIYISTPSIYFNFTHRFDVKETDALPSSFVNNYAKTKWMAEQDVLGIERANFIKVVLRPRAILGAGDTTIMPRVIHAYQKGKLKIIGDGENLADFTSVKNLSYATWLALEKGKSVDQGVFNITDDKPLKLWPLLENTLQHLDMNHPLKKIPYRLVFRIAGVVELYHRLFSSKEPAITKYGIAVLNYSLTMNIDAAKKQLNYTPIITTEESIKEFIESYRNGK
jgi:2-alkyl-3-oxoalkanoate reductase